MIIPTYNRSALIQRALKSVAAQTVAPSEVLVIDDGSTESIEAAVNGISGLPARVVRRAERGGAAAARNTGVSESKGDFLAFLDSDDEWAPEKLSRQLAYLDSNPRVQLCCTGFVLRQPSGDQTRRFGRESMVMADLAFGCGLSPGTTLCVRRGLLDLVGPFDERMPRLEDWDWLIRATQYSMIGLLDTPLATVHTASEPLASDVNRSISILQKKHETRFRQLGLEYLLKFRAALLNERAVSEFRHRHYVRSMALFSLSLLVYPFRRLDYFVRVSKRILSELRPRPDTR